MAGWRRSEIRTAAVPRAFGPERRRARLGSCARELSAHRQVEFPAGDRRASQLVGHQLLGRSRLPLQELAEELLDSSRIQAMRDQDIRDIAVAIHRPPEIAALPAGRDEDFIHMPDIAQPATPTAQVPSKPGTELAAPRSRRFLGGCDASLGERVSDIPEAECESMIEPYIVTD